MAITIRANKLNIGENVVGISSIKYVENAKFGDKFEITFANEVGVKEMFKVTVGSDKCFDLLSALDFDVSSGVLELEDETDLLGLSLVIDVQSFDTTKDKMEEVSPKVWEPVLDENGDKVQVDVTYRFVKKFLPLGDNEPVEVDVA